MKPRPAGSTLLDRVPRFAVMAVPLNEVDVHEAPGRTFRVDFQEHIGIGIVAGGGHGVMLRAVEVAVVDPLMNVAGDYKLDGVLVLLQERVEAIVGKLHRAILNEWVVDEDEGGFVLLELGFKPVELGFAEGANTGVEVG